MLIEEGKDYVLPSGVEPPYRSIKNLGYGNSGTVDKVEDINTGIVYARKTIRLHAGRRKAERRRIFDNEAKIIRDLATHHHIIRVFATYYDDPDVCLIMHPVADSGDLETFLQGVRDEIEECGVDSERRPDEIKVSTLERAFGCLANGLAFMHQQRIRHKDIKSKNILVHQGNVVYTDFGISGNFSQADSSTTEGPAMGLTRRYSAPEVIEQEPRNSSSDVYSLGCVFIEILSALTGSFTVDFRTPYCDDMERLRTAIESCTLSSARQDLARLAITMTLEEKNQRPTSFQVWTELRGRRGYSCAQCVSQYSLESVQPTPVGVADVELVNWGWDYYYNRAVHYVYQDGTLVPVTNQNNMQPQAVSDAKHNALRPQNSEQSSGRLHFASALSNLSVDDDWTIVQSGGVEAIDNAQLVDNRASTHRTTGSHAHSPRFRIGNMKRSISAITESVHQGLWDD